MNPFGQGGYVQLPTHNEAPGAPLPASNRREEEEGFFACEYFAFFSFPLFIFISLFPFYATLLHPVIHTYDQPISVLPCSR
jgi:hypothetical protein